MNINTIFRIADAAKNIRDYKIANAAFAVIAACAVIAKKYGSQVGDCDASRVAFLYEYDHNDIIGALASTSGGLGRTAGNSRLVPHRPKRRAIACWRRR